MNRLFFFLLFFSAWAVAAEAPRGYCDQAAGLARGAAENAENGLPVSASTDIIANRWPIAHMMYPDITQDDMLDLVRMVYAMGWGPADAYSTILTTCQQEQEKQEKTAAAGH